MKFLRKLFRVAHYHLRGGVRHGRILGVEIGLGCRVYISDWGSEPYLIRIGNNVTITGGVKLLTHDGSTCLIESDGIRYYKYGRVSIGDNVFIGTNAILMPGVSVIDNVVIGAGSVVTKNLDKSGVYVGSPAIFVKSFDDFTNKLKKIGTQRPPEKSFMNDKERVMFHLEKASKLR